MLFLDFNIDHQIIGNNTSRSTGENTICDLITWSMDSSFNQLVSAIFPSPSCQENFRKVPLTKTEWTVRHFYFMRWSVIRHVLVVLTRVFDVSLIVFGMWLCHTVSYKISAWVCTCFFKKTTMILWFFFFLLKKTIIILWFFFLLYSYSDLYTFNIDK